MMYGELALAKTRMEMEMQREKEKESKAKKEKQKQLKQPAISMMKPVTKGAYGGGMYGTEQAKPEIMSKPPASDTQNADGPVESERTVEPKHKPPPSSGDRDIDITGQSYIQ
ncbi:hypothetical protein AQUCO_00900158v1 [Aquilegia coerulea]|uniref:Uncharacterized protein n=1 Tax=Aquilegia coerulea TaxID=218851 RepID=A0A2G5EC93_AQUCA|nr:hypothetical protein AQUCO_00900158v1 [Aquilegia coerulea]